MKCPNAASLPVRMTWAFWTAITGAPGEAAIAAPVTVGPDELALAAASCGGGAGTPVGGGWPARCTGETPADDCGQAADQRLRCGGYQLAAHDHRFDVARGVVVGVDRAA